MFEGHLMYKLGNGWVFNLTECVGYKVILDTDKKQVLDYIKAFRISNDKHDKHHVYKYISVPLGIIKKAESIVENYHKEAFIKYDK